MEQIALRTVLALIGLLLTASGTPNSDPDLASTKTIGSHNSYRPVPDAPAMRAIRAHYGDAIAGLEYGHPAIARQFDLGVRQLEFDVYADPQGGRFAESSPAASRSTMRRAGLKVMHTPLVDAQTHCLTLALCFSTVAKWSARHPNHEVIYITIDTKEVQHRIKGVPEPLLFTASDLDEIDATARQAFGQGRLITPDDVRGRQPTLRDAVLARNWPTARAARGKIMLILDSNPRIAELYRLSYPNLAGRSLFGLYGAGEPEAAVFNIQDPVAEEARIVELVSQGFIVRTRSDANTAEARRNDHSRLAAAVRSGAQIISTDYYAGAPDPLRLGFEVKLR